MRLRTPISRRLGSGTTHYTDTIDIEFPAGLECKVVDEPFVKSEIEMTRISITYNGITLTTDLPKSVLVE